MSDYTSYVEDASDFDLSNTIHRHLAVNDIIASFEAVSDVFGIIVAQANHMIDYGYINWLEKDMESDVESEVESAWESYQRHINRCAENAIINAPMLCGGLQNVPDWLFCESAVQLVKDAMVIS